MYSIQILPNAGDATPSRCRLDLIAQGGNGVLMIAHSRVWLGDHWD